MKSFINGWVKNKTN